MKKYYILALSILLAAGSVTARSTKRGVSENNFQFNAQVDALAPGVSWYYNWGNTPGNAVINNESMEYVPMCWNGNFNSEKIRQYVKEHPDTKYILGFNEPNFTNQANMTPAQAAEKWPEVQALAKELNLKIVGPALNYSPNAPYQDPLKWMDEFVALVGIDAFDYTAVHSYGGFGVTQTLATNFHNKYGKPVWITEFCYWPGESGSTYVSPEAQIACMISSLEWMEKTEWVHRYAWFKAIGQSNASNNPNYGLLLSGKGEDPRDLSEQGKVYVYLTDFDKSVYHPVDQWIPASDIIAQNGILLGGNNNAEVDSKLEITQFNGGASADYQFETGAATRAFMLRVAGMGEPTRFDPTVGIFTVDEQGNEIEQVGANTQFTLTNSNTEYKSVSVPVVLPAGKYTLRVKDVTPGAPSGMRISAVCLDVNFVDPSGVKNLTLNGNETVDVYSIQGVKVRAGVDKADALNTLPAGIYIVDGQKIIKK